MKQFYCFLVITYITNFAIGFVGNTLVIIYLRDSLKKGKQINKSLARILLNLAIADILTEVFGSVAVLFEYEVFGHPKEALGDAVCKLLTSHTLTWSFTNISVLTVVLLAWERYRAVTQFKSKAASPDGEARYMKYIVISFWFIGPGAYSPFIPFQVYDQEQGCHESFPSNSFKYGIPLFDITCFFVAPSIFFAYAYFNIVRALKKPSKDMSERRQRQFSYRKVRRQLTLTAMLIVGGYFACWSAAYVIYTVQVISDADNVSLDTAYEIAIIFAYFASTSHPIIYSFRSRQFRNKIKEIICNSTVLNCMGGVTLCRRKPQVEPSIVYVIRGTEGTELGVRNNLGIDAESFEDSRPSNDQCYSASG